MAALNSQFPLPPRHFSGQANTTTDHLTGLRSLLNLLAASPDVVQETVARTILVGDEGANIELDTATVGAFAVTFPPSGTDFPVGFSTRLIQTAGAENSLTFVAGGGVTLVGRSAVTNAVVTPANLEGQWAVATAEVIATDTWLISGQID